MAVASWPWGVSESTVDGDTHPPRPVVADSARVGAGVVARGAGGESSFPRAARRARARIEVGEGGVGGVKCVTKGQRKFLRRTFEVRRIRHTF